MAGEDQPSHALVLLQENEHMPEQIFKNVWYLPDENTWSDLNLLAYRDTGILIVRDGSLEFQGAKGRVVITSIRRVSFGKQGRDFVNNWVKIE